MNIIIFKMKNSIKLICLALFIISFFNCGKKKETDPMGNPVEEVKTIAVKPTSKELGKEIFEGKGMCSTCHKPDVKLIGPSIKDIATIYSDKKGSITLFLQGEADPIVDPTQYEIMKANFAITKMMTDEEIKGLEDYMLSIK